MQSMSLGTYPQEHAAVHLPQPQQLQHLLGLQMAPPGQQK